MPEYLRAYIPGGTFFFTLVTNRRRPLFQTAANVARLRTALATVRREKPFNIPAGVALPDPIHFIWTLPIDDADFFTRLGQINVLFTRSIRPPGTRASSDTPSRQRKRESDVWQRRFWEHTIRHERDLERHVEYIHYNPVKHELTSCPHRWQHSSFKRLVDHGIYDQDWCCACHDAQVRAPSFAEMSRTAGE